MVPSHWMAFIGLVQVVGGLLVLVGRTTPLGLVLLGPVLVNILAFHIFLLGGQGIAPGFVVTVRHSSMYIGVQYVVATDPGRGASARKGSTVIVNIV